MCVKRGDLQLANIYTRKTEKGITKYYGDINYNGKRYRKYLADNKKTALKEIIKLEHRIYNAPFSNDMLPKVKIINAYWDFLRNIELSGIKDVKIGVLPRLHRFNNFLNGMKIINLDEITPKHIQDFLVIRKKVKVMYDTRIISTSSLNKEIQVIKRFLSYCLSMQLVDKNPALAIKYFKKEGVKQRFYFGKTEINNILIQSAEFCDFFTFLLETGLRPTDTFNLKPQHILDGYLKLKMNKTDDILSIPLPNTINRLLESRMANDYIFSEVRTDWNRKLCLRNLKQHFTKDFSKNNNINLHTFRHTYAHTMLNKGVPKEVLQTLLGHRSIRTTEIYANWVRKEELEKWV